MPPLSNRVVVGTGLRAFANGESLRSCGHEVFYCTRREDLPDSAAKGKKSTKSKSADSVTQVKGKNHPPGDLQRISKPLESALVSSAAAPAGPALSGRAPAPKASKNDGSGLAAAGGALGSPGNPFAFTDPHELHEVVRYVDPEVILAEAPEEVRHLPAGNFRLILDLFAPRILEQQFQAGSQERESVVVFDALQRADAFLFSNERQKYYHLPLLALAGIDCTKTAGVVIPISGPPGASGFHKPKQPVFVAGGVFWPWADLGPGLVDLHACLAKAGKGAIHLYGGEYGIRSDTETYCDPREALPKRSKHLKFKGMVAIDKLWEQYSKASVAFDLTSPNPERELNLSFRQIDYLRCGLPIITSPRQVIAEQLLSYQAGWCVEPGDSKALQSLVKDLLAHPDKIAKASSAAQKLAAERFTWDSSASRLDELVRTVAKRTHAETFINRLSRTQSDLWQEHEENKRLRETVLHLQDDQGKKSEEIQSLNSRLGVLLSSVDRLSGSITAVSRFKNDMLLFLHEAEDAALREAAELTTEVERLQLDIKKKDAAIKAGKREQAKAASSMAKQEELLAVELEKKDKEFAAAAKETRGELAKSAAALMRQEELLKSELDKKDRDIAALNRELRNEQTSTTSRLAKQEELFKAEIDKKDKDIAALSREVRNEKGSSAKALAKQEELLEAELDKKDRDFAAAAKETKAELLKASKALGKREKAFAQELDKKDKEIAQLGLDVQNEQDAVARSLTRQEEAFRAGLEKKDQEIGRLGEERALVQKRLDQSLEQAQQQTDLLAAARVEVSDLEGRINLAGNKVEAGRLEVERLKDRLQQARFEHKKLLQELDKKEREVNKAQKTRDSTKAKLEAANKKLEERLTKAEFMHRNLLEEAAKKDVEVQEAQVERDTMKAGLEASISSLEERLAKAEFEYRTLVEETSKKDGEIEETMAERDNIKARLDGDIDSLKARLTRLDYEHRNVLEQFAKKEGEFSQVQRAYKRLTTENEQLNVKAGSLEGRLEESQFQIKVLDTEIEKKNDEIADAQSRRDALAEALQEERAQHARGGVLLRRKLKSEFLGKN